MACGRTSFEPSATDSGSARLAAALTVRGQATLDRLRRAATGGAAGRDRGDVNGYVFVTLMTAGIVMVIWVIARDRLASLFERAISSVGP
jgi:hypothetical protein